MAVSELQSSIFSRKFRAFLRWMCKIGIEYTDGIAFELGGSRSVADMGVRAVCSMQAHELIATIPKQACLTTKTSAAAKLIEEEGIAGGLGLAIALMFEKSLQERSRWFAYLQVLPAELKLPFLWSPSEIDSLLVGTELYQVIKEDKVLMEEDWKECIVPLTLLHANEFPAKWFTLDDYLSAKALVSSRAFEVDEYHGFGMVPLADLFNHKTAAEDVHLRSVISDSESDAEAGSESVENLLETNGKCKKRSKMEKGQQRQSQHTQDLHLSPVVSDLDSDAGACPGSENKLVKADCESMKPLKVGSGRHSKSQHASEEPSDVSSSLWEGNSELLEMILVKDVAQGSEIFNTYGSLSNAALLHRYGFTEADNPFDIVNIELALVSEVCSKTLSSRHIRRRISQWRKAGGCACVSQGCEYFEIIAAGKPQEDLLILLFLIHLPDEACDGLPSAKDIPGQGIEGIARALGWDGLPNKEKKRSRQRKQGMKGKVKKPDLSNWLLTVSVCKTMLELLKLRESLYPTPSLEDDLTLLSTITVHEHPRLFHALRLRISERTILKSCQTFVSSRLESCESRNGD